MSHRIPSLNGLRAFEAAARHLSFTLAAAELGVTAGAVSQQVRKLETSLGISLFRRLPQGLLLTAAGEAYHPRISQAFEDLTAATEAVAPDINTRAFSLGLSADAVHLLPQPWPERRSDLRRYLRETQVTDDVALILDNALDAVVRRGPPQLSGLSALALSEDATTSGFHFVCRNGLLNCRQSQAIVEELSRLLAEPALSETEER
ncbi:MAG: LysR family transcriptional regulator [Pseudomonadota bacterium]